MFDLFLEPDFLCWFGNNMPTPSATDDTQDHYWSLWRHFFKILQKAKGKIHFMGSNAVYGESLKNMPDDLKHIFANIAMNGARFDFDCQPNNHGNACKVYCGKSNPYKQFIPTIPFAQDFYPAWKKLTQPTEFKLQKQSSNSPTILCLKQWSDLKNQLPVSNALVICDNYLLKSNVTNFIDIIKTLLPRQIGETIPQIIFLGGGELYNHTPLEKIGAEIDEKLYEYWDSDDFDLILVQTDPPDKKNMRLHYHDRHIFTNTFLLESGNTFAFFKNGQTTIETELKKISMFSFHNETELMRSFYQKNFDTIKDIIKKIDSRCIYKNKEEASNRLLF